MFRVFPILTLFIFVSPVAVADETSSLKKPARIGYDWSGVYAGVEAGGIEISNNWSGSVTQHGTHTSSGEIVGVRLGLRNQVNNFVFGGELKINKSLFDSVSTSQSGATNKIFEEFSAALVGKLGVSYDRALIYALAGYASAQVKNEYNPKNINYPPESFSTSVGGFVLGSGVEYAISSNLYVGLEYLHYNFGDYKNQTSFWAPSFESNTLSKNMVAMTLSVALD